MAPGATVGGQAGVGLRRGIFTVDVEGRVETMLEGAVLSPRDRVTASVYTGAIVPCGHFSLIAVCVGGRAGSLQGTALDVSRPALKASFFSAGFVRIGVRLPIGRFFAARAALEGAMPLVRTSFVVDDVPIWTAPAVHASAILGVELHSL